MALETEGGRLRGESGSSAHAVSSSNPREYKVQTVGDESSSNSDNLNHGERRWKKGVRTSVIHFLKAADASNF